MFKASVYTQGCFVDALCLHYGWTPAGAPIHCDCGANFSVEHVLSCSRGGFPSIRHNEIRDITADLLTVICHDVSVEPDLQPPTGKALSHTELQYIWRCQTWRLCERVLGGGATRKHSWMSGCSIHMIRPTKTQVLQTDTSMKIKQAYKRDVEHSSFTPIVFSATGVWLNSPQSSTRDLPSSRKVGAAV